MFWNDNKDKTAVYWSIICDTACNLKENKLWLLQQCYFSAYIWFGWDKIHVFSTTLWWAKLHCLSGLGPIIIFFVFCNTVTKHLIIVRWCIASHYYNFDRKNWPIFLTYRIQLLLLYDYSWKREKHYNVCTLHQIVVTDDHAAYNVNTPCEWYHRVGRLYK